MITTLIDAYEIMSHSIMLSSKAMKLASWHEEEHRSSMLHGKCALILLLLAALHTVYGVPRFALAIEIFARNHSSLFTPEQSKNLEPWQQAPATE